MERTVAITRPQQQAHAQRAVEATGEEAELRQALSALLRRPHDCMVAAASGCLDDAQRAELDALAQRLDVPLPAELSAAGLLPLSRRARAISEEIAAKLDQHERALQRGAAEANAAELQAALQRVDPAAAPDLMARLLAVMRQKFQAIHNVQTSGEQCAACGQRAGGALPVDKLRVCDRCRVARYCCKACQRSHWALHKTMCRGVAPPRDATV